MKKFLVYAIYLFSLQAFAQTADKTYHERYRPQFHFSPAVNWTNDPNGLVYYKGLYHLFYQYNPYDKVWGHMSWGHATSRDLVHWRQEPLAIPEDSAAMIFSGSCVVDANNTSGFAKEPGQTVLVAIYTSHHQPGALGPDNQAQSIAYSLDGGKTFTKYAHNPVLDIHRKDFRDPFVFWYALQKKWVMAVVLPPDHIVQFYGSKNLREWSHLSDFGPAGDTSSIWECPSITRVPIAGKADAFKWVLFNSIQVSEQYFVGEFDGTRFRTESPHGQASPIDYGPDNYAAIVYNHLPAGQAPVLLGWANNWNYAGSIPVSPWRGAMTMPRELSLEPTDGNWKLLQRPVPAIRKLRTDASEQKNIRVDGKKPIGSTGTTLEVELTWSPAPKTVSGIRLAAGKSGAFVIGYDEARQVLFIDRRSAGDSSFNRNYDSLAHYEAPLRTDRHAVSLDVFFDNSIIEVFGANGSVVLTSQVFPSANNRGVELFCDNGPVVFDKVNVWRLKSAW
ncbi:MAG TPA: glycoside hydrolase family 32 protein [Puia sp.]|nr:glycoside hydrolase family 32 protein [Puia sp.]